MRARNQRQTRASHTCTLLRGSSSACQRARTNSALIANRIQVHNRANGQESLVGQDRPASRSTLPTPAQHYLSSSSLPLYLSTFFLPPSRRAPCKRQHTEWRSLPLYLSSFLVGEPHARDSIQNRADHPHRAHSRPKLADEVELVQRALLRRGRHFCW